MQMFSSAHHPFGGRYLSHITDLSNMNFISVVRVRFNAEICNSVVRCLKNSHNVELRIQS